MNTAEKIGLLPGFGWIADHNFATTLLICWFLTPGMMIIIGLIGESRLIPLTPSYQFLSFFPGDLFLGGTAAGLLVLANRLPAENHWYNTVWFHALVVFVTFAVAVIMTRSELHGGVYPPRAIYCPTKLYHNILLYGGYGYIIVTSLIAVLASAETRGTPLVACLLPGLVWVSLLILEQRASDTVKDQRVRYAHVPDWSPIWLKR